MDRRRDVPSAGGEVRYPAAADAVAGGGDDAQHARAVHELRPGRFEPGAQDAAQRLAGERLRLALGIAAPLAFTLDRALRTTWLFTARPDFDERAFAAAAVAALATIYRDVIDSGTGARREVPGSWLALPDLPWVELVVEPLREGGAEVVGVVCTVLDISVRKAAEEALRKRHDDLAQAQAMARTGSWRLNVQRNELQWSDECARIFGLAPRGLRTYEHFLAAVHPDDRDFVHQRWTAALRGEPYDIEHRILADGVPRWVRERAALEFDAAGNLLGGFGTAQDVTERKALELALHATEQQLRLFIDNAPAAIAMLDRELRYIVVSRRFLQDYGIAAEAVIGRNVFDVLPAMPSRWREAHRRCLAGESLHHDEDSFVRADGTLEWVRWEAKPWWTADGTVGGTIMYSENISRHKAADAAQREALLAAERANAAKSRFLAAASHDLRQPLSALSLYVGVLDHKLPCGEGLLLRSIKDCVASLSELLADLLDLSKLDAGVVTPTLSDFAVDEVLGRIISAHGPEARLKGLDLRYAAPRLVARTDPVLFGRIIGNLVANAVRYTERGGVLVGCRRRDGKMWIEVWDTGIGIPADKTDEIFEEFRQLGNDERTRGSGLGLAIVARMAAVLGLRVRVASRPGRGSLFAVEVPRGRAQHKLAAYDHPCRPLRIGLVEDNSDVLRALTYALRESGHQVVGARSGAQLLLELDGHAPDILICDYRLAGRETGFQAITAARAAFGSQLAAMIITGDTHPDLMRSMADRGIVVQHKPLDLGALQACIARLTDRRGA
jgi:PAS domain S-box-containing protein